MGKLSWKTLSHKLIENQLYSSNINLPNTTQSKPMLPLQPSRYQYLKDLSNTKLHRSYDVLKDYDRPGALRLEPYLNTYSERGDNKLKSLVRLNRLRLNYVCYIWSDENTVRAGRKQKNVHPYCPQCANVLETQFHFIMECPLYNDLRESLFSKIKDLFGHPLSPMSWDKFSALALVEQMDILCGKFTGNLITDQGIDRRFKSFLKDAWSVRQELIEQEGVAVLK